MTPDHVNPEAPWPHLEALERDTLAAGRTLTERLALIPAYVREAQRWVDATLLPAVLRRADASGRARADGWYAGAGTEVPARLRAALFSAARAPPADERGAHASAQARTSRHGAFGS